MRLPGSSSILTRQAGALGGITFLQALIFAVGAAFGSILTKLLGLEYASWIIVALCWPLVMIFAMFDRGRQRENPHTSPRHGEKSGAPPRRPISRGNDRLHRVK
jgi:apolipoprotein N-acyltransferase